MSRVAKKETLPAPLEERATAAFNGLDRKLRPITDTMLGIIRLKSQADADLLSGVINNDIPAIEKQIWEWFGQDAKVAYDHWKALREKENRFGKPLADRLASYRQILARYQYAERQKAITEAANKQTAIDEAAPELGIVVEPREVKVEGAKLVMRKCHRVVNLLALVKLVAQGKAPLVAIEANDTFLAGQTRQLFDTCQPDADGKKWLYKDAVEVYEEPSVTRR